MNQRPGQWCETASERAILAPASHPLIAKSQSDQDICVDAAAKVSCGWHEKNLTRLEELPAASPSGENFHGASIEPSEAEPVGYDTE